MNLPSVNLIYFSPTGTSRKVVKAIGRGLGAKQINEFDITQTDFEFKNFGSELTIIGVPVYKGRLPVEVIPRLKKINAENTPVVLVAVYGNRDFDDALLELKDLSEELGFTPLAAAAFIGEHSYSTESKPIAKNRPDEADLLKAKQFAGEILDKLEKNDGLELNVSGNYPYKELPNAPVMSPGTIDGKCTLCGVCADVCPVDVIEVNKTVITNAEACIWCCACVKACPEDARTFDAPLINQITNNLFENCSERKEPVFFI
ncbi:EFR1 family ferrodoxin [Labilibaculum sp. K2S]|uniref:EFR1 family ferrodoxin n=1 Tax=Labilibaculum sp. K2S TaxID=3056386 RepID=UPI0025A3320B|nr:EFR1 family ferrodoxin [Labilibaculum sp. K2S]MDM8161563.1 EFR1 family ferrodoxin [Labilibaculum sp. K2S]